MAKDLKNWRELQDINEGRTEFGGEDIEDELGNNPALEEERKERFFQLFPQYAPGTAEASTRAISAAGAAEPADVSDLALAVDYGGSRGDYKVRLEDFVQDPVNIRANAQSTGAKIVNGLLKMPIYAASTYIDNTAGLVDSLLQIGRDAGDGNGFRPLQSAINTPTAEAMQRWRDWSERVLPNYRTEEETNDPEHWYARLNGNFWGDVILKNFGFTLGAGLSGASLARLSSLARGKKVSDIFKGSVVAASEAEETALSGARNQMTVFDRLKDEARRLKTKGIENQLIGGIGGALGESRMEAMMAAREFHDPQLEKINAEYSAAYDAILEDMRENDPQYFGINPLTGQYDLTAEGQQEAMRRAQRMNETRLSRIDKLEDESAKLANTVFWLNMPLLAADNIIQFGRFFAGGYGTNFKTKVKGPAGMYTGTGSAWGAAGRGLLNAYTEGQEEMLQKVFSEGAKNIADTNMAAFHNKQYDKKAIDSVGKWMTSMLGSAGDVITDATSWEEFTAGFLTGALGIPGRRWQGGVIGGVMDSIDDRKRSQVLAEAANKYYNDPKLRSIMKGLVRNQAEENIKDEALENNDSFAWHTANDGQLMNAVLTYAEIGRLEDLEDIADGFANVSERDVARLKKIEEGEESLSPALRNKSNKEILDSFHERADELKRTIDQYRQFYNVADYYAGGPAKGEDYNDYINRLSDSVLGEMVKEIVYTKAQLQNFENRYHDLYAKVAEGINPSLQVAVKGVNKKGNPTKAASAAQDVLANMQSMQSLFGGRKKTTDSFVRVYSDDQRSALSHLNAMSRYTDDEVLKSEIDDLKKLVNIRQLYYDKLYDPRNIGRSIKTAFEQSAVRPETVAADMKEESLDKAMDEAMTALKSVVSVQEFDDFLGDFAQTHGKEAADRLYAKVSESGDEKLKGYQKTLSDFRDYTNNTLQLLQRKREAPSVTADEARVLGRVSELFTQAAQDAYSVDEVKDGVLRLSATEPEPVRTYIESMLEAQTEDEAAAASLGGKPAASPASSLDSRVNALAVLAKLQNASVNPLFSADEFRGIWEPLDASTKKTVETLIDNGSNQLLKDTLKVVKGSMFSTDADRLREEISKINNPSSGVLTSYANGKFGDVNLTDEEKEDVSFLARARIETLRQEAGLVAGAQPSDSNFDDKQEDAEETLDEREKTEAQKAVEKLQDTSLSGDRIQVWHQNSLLSGVAVPYSRRITPSMSEEERADAQRLNAAADWLREHRQQDFIDYGALAALQKAYRNKNHSPLPVYFLANPVASETNPFCYENPKTGKKLQSMLFAVEVTEEDRATTLRPFYTSGILRESDLLQIDGASYQVIGVAKPMQKASVNKMRYDDLYGRIIYNGIQKNQETDVDQFYVSKMKDGTRYHTTLRYLFSGRNITRETATSDSTKVPLSTSLREYRSVGGDIGFALVTVQDGARYDIKSSPITPDMPAAINPAPGSLWLTTTGADGRNHWTYVNILRADEYDFESNKEVPVIRDLLKDIDSLFDASLSFEDLRLVANRIQDVLYFGKAGGIRFYSSGGRRTVDINGVDCHSPQEVLQAIRDQRLRFQIDSAAIQQDTIEKYIEAGILCSDMRSFIRRGANFGVSFLDKEDNPEDNPYFGETPGVSRRWQPEENVRSVNIQLNTLSDIQGYKVYEDGRVMTMDTGQEVTDDATIATVNNLAILINSKGDISTVKDFGGTKYTNGKEGAARRELYIMRDGKTGLTTYSMRQGTNGAFLPISEQVFNQWLAYEEYTEERPISEVAEKAVAPEVGETVSAGLGQRQEQSDDAAELDELLRSLSADKKAREDDDITVQDECYWDF